jgi:hypothetical protein
VGNVSDVGDGVGDGDELFDNPITLVKIIRAVRMRTLLIMAMTGINFQILPCSAIGFNGRRGFIGPQNSKPPRS